MDCSTLFRYLFFFDHQAIREIADAASPLWALILVLSAGVARNHARHDLMAQPWRVLTPIAASFVTAAALFLFIQIILWLHSTPTIPLAAGFWCFLGLYWATAPLAWVYGIPFEWLLGVDRAERARLISLGVVAAWRIVLVFHVLFVFMDGGAFAVLAILLLVESIIALIALGLLTSAKDTANRPRVSSTLIEVMGGIMLGPQTLAELNAGEWDFDKLSDSPPPFRSRERTERVAQFVASACLYTAMIGLIMNFWVSPKASAWSSIQTNLDLGSRGMLWFSILVLFFWVVIALSSQPAQRRKSHLHRLFNRGEIHAAIEYLAQRPASAFPAAWEPPPSEAFRGTPSILDIMEALAAIKPGGWVEASYAPRIRHYVAHAGWYWHYAGERTRLCEVLEKLPDGPELAKLALAGIDRLEQVLATCRDLHGRSKAEAASLPNSTEADRAAYSVTPSPDSEATDDSIVRQRLQVLSEKPAKKM